MGNNQSEQEQQEQQQQQEEIEEQQETEQPVSSATKNDNNDSDKSSDIDKTSTQNNNAVIDEASLKEYTMEEVAVHTSEENGVWIVLNNFVYDVTKFLYHHPGGADFLLQAAGGDATNEFESAMHSANARKKNKTISDRKIEKNNW